MLELLPVLLNYGFRELRLNRVEAAIDPMNTRSIRGVERLGSQYKGYMRERHMSEEGPRDEVYYSMLNSDWRSTEDSLVSRSRADELGGGS